MVSIFISLIVSVTLSAQNNVGVEAEADPNSALNIPRAKIESMCSCARNLATKLYKELDFLTPFEERILIKEGYREAQIMNLYATDSERLFEIIRTAWNEKWSKVYCITDASGIFGYLDKMLLFSYQHKAFQHLYDSNWPIRANIIRLVNYDPYAPVSENPVTIMDMIERMLKEKQGQIAYRQSLEEDIKSKYQDIIYYGGKNVKALSTEEFKLELERARKEGKYPKVK